VNIPINTQRLFTPASLPPGLTLNATTGVLSGTPTTSGTYTFPIRVTDASYPAQTATQTYTLVVAPNTTVPSITLQPVSQTIDQGQTATFTTASLGGNLTYQWKFNGVNLTNSTGTTSPGSISGATTATLTITNALGASAGSASDAGTYTCYVSNAYGNTTTNGAVLTVSSGPVITITSPGTTSVGVPNIANSLLLTASATSPITTPTVTWSKVSGPGTVTFANANSASTSATFSSTGTYVLAATASDGDLSASTSLTVGAGVAAPTTGTTVVDQLSFTGSLTNDGQAVTGTFGGTTWTRLLSAVSSGTTTVTTSTATPLLNLKTSSNTNSGIQFIWTNSFAFASSGRGTGGSGPSYSGTATDGLSTYTATSTLATAGVTLTNGSEFFPWTVMKDYNAVHDGTDGYASFKFSSSTPMAYTFWVASSYNNGANASSSSTAWPTLINIGGTYSESGAKFTGGTTLLLQGSQSQSSDGTVRYAVGQLSTTGGFVSTYNSSTGLYELNVQVGSGINSTSTGAVLNGLILQAAQVFTVNNAPQVNPGTVSNPVPGTAISLAGTASDDGLPTGSSLTTTWSLASGPASVTFGNANAAATTVTFPQGGTYVLTLSGTDGSATAFQNLTVVVPSTFTPVFSGTTTPAAVVAGTPFQYQIMASGSPTSYSATGLPTGLTLNTSTGLISGSPTVTGVFTVTIYATNASGTASETITITVNSPTDTPTLPQWALILLGALLCAVAIRSVPTAHDPSAS
jgi:hypothetical protein